MNRKEALKTKYEIAELEQIIEKRPGNIEELKAQIHNKYKEVHGFRVSHEETEEAIKIINNLKEQINEEEKALRSDKKKLEMRLDKLKYVGL